MTPASLKVGDTLPELVVPITASAVVAAAIATNDYEDVHHDKAAAESKGMPDIFMNILSTNGFVQRFVSDWAGPSAQVTNVRIKLGAPNFVGDAMIMKGSIASIEGDTIAIDVSGRNRIGEHVAAQVTLDFGAAR